MTAHTRRRLMAAVKLGLAAVPFAVLLRWSDPQARLVGSLLLGFSLGFLAGLIEFFAFRDWFRRLRFLPHLVMKSLVMMSAMYVAFALLNLLDVFIDGGSWSQYARAITSPGVLLGLLIALAVTSMLLFFVHLDRLLGPGVLIGYILGRYHRPRVEERVFMFLDLKGSTSLAEGMDANEYFRFLQRYFAEMSDPILETRAEIYQYVGDEVVLTWPLGRGLHEAACIRAFFLIDRRMTAKSQMFRVEYGVVPEFKAGLHAGPVIAAQIGEIKGEIVYSGDVLNTTARIQAQCNPLGHRLLVSQTLLERLDLPSEFSATHLGSVGLRGKAAPEELWAVDALDVT